MSTNRKHSRSAEDIQLLLQYPKIFKHASQNRLAFTLKFRKYIWDRYGAVPHPKDVRQALKELTGNPDVIQAAGKESIHHLADSIKSHGMPRGAANDTFDVRQQNRDPEYDQYLLSKGYLKAGKNGYSFTDKFRLILISRPENQGIQTALKEAGLKPEKIGYQRLTVLKREEQEWGYARISGKLTSSDIECLKLSPFIKNATPNQIRFCKEFDLWAARLKNHFSQDQILLLFGIDKTHLSTPALFRLYQRIRYFRISEDSSEKIPGTEKQVCLFLWRYMKLLLAQTSEGFKTAGALWSKLSCAEKKMIGLIIKDTSSKEDGFTVSSLLRVSSIPRSSWYGIWKEGYGTSAEKRKIKDQEDGKEIQKICQYKGFGKGSRQVRLQMIRKTGKTISIGRVRRLMKEYGCACTIRRRNSARVSRQKLLDTYLKPNILGRQFRLFRPGEVILTDVSYLDYGVDRQRAYLSALKDSVSGRIHALLVSDSQDQRLSEMTIDSLPEPKTETALFHSDQGILYLNPEFQEKLKSRGYEQSMSRRGNCWDNSSMESFFGHFKDECSYQECQSLEELDEMLQSYAFYYNFERVQPCRQNMTPVEYEKKLLEMNESEWDKYWYRQLHRYNKMLEKAAASAIERARRDQEIISRSRYGRKKLKEKEKQKQIEIITDNQTYR